MIFKNKNREQINSVPFINNLIVLIIIFFITHIIMTLLNCYLFPHIFSYNIVEFGVIVKKNNYLDIKIKTNIKMNNKNIKKFLGTKIEIPLSRKLKILFHINYAKMTRLFYNRITILKKNNINFKIGTNIMKCLIKSIISESENIEKLGYLDKKQVEYCNYIKHIDFIQCYKKYYDKYDFILFENYRNMWTPKPSKTYLRAKKEFYLIYNQNKNNQNKNNQNKNKQND